MAAVPATQTVARCELGLARPPTAAQVNSAQAAQAERGFCVLRAVPVLIFKSPVYSDFYIESNMALTFENLCRGHHISSCGGGCFSMLAMETLMSVSRSFFILFLSRRVSVKVVLFVCLFFDCLLMCQ